MNGSPSTLTSLDLVCFNNIELSTLQISPVFRCYLHKFIIMVSLFFITTFFLLSSSFILIITCWFPLQISLFFCYIYLFKILSSPLLIYFSREIFPQYPPPVFLYIISLLGIFYLLVDLYQSFPPQTPPHLSLYFV